MFFLLIDRATPGIEPYCLTLALHVALPISLTVRCGVYSISLPLALVVLGSSSDHIGRRPVIVGALLLNVIAMVLFLMAQTVSMLIAARLLQGLATGAATSALAAGLMDSDRRRSPLLNSVAPMIALAVGALGTSILMQFAPAPIGRASCREKM